MVKSGKRKTMGTREQSNLGSRQQGGLENHKSNKVGNKGG